MQITIKSTRIIKEGERKDGTPYKWLSVMADDGSEKGTEYTTFDQKPLNLGAGAVIDIGDPDTKEGKLSFKKVVKVISEGAPPAPGPTNGGRSEMTPELWAEKDRLERHSMESMSSYRGILELAATEQFNKLRAGSDATKAKLDKALDKALDWALDHFTPAPAPKPTTQAAKKTEDTPDLSSMVFADAGKLKTACVDYVKINLAQIDKETAGYDLTTEKGRKDAWAAILVAYEKNHDEKLFE